MIGSCDSLSSFGLILCNEVEAEVEINGTIRTSTRRGCVMKGGDLCMVAAKGQLPRCV